MLFVRVKDAPSIESYVRAAWLYDEELPSYYDRNLVIRDYENMVFNTCSKIQEYITYSYTAWLYGIEIDRKPIGFVVINTQSKLLYSFGINKNYRTPEVLSSFWDFIYRIMKAEFSCFLFHHNTRAISWLIKCGMVQENYTGLNEDMVYLKTK